MNSSAACLELIISEMICRHTGKKLSLDSCNQNKSAFAIQSGPVQAL
jgi:hypothetical protein